MSNNVEEMLNSYIEAMLWSNTDDEGDPLDANYDKSDIASETLELIRNDIEKFAAENESDILCWGHDCWSQAGHDFWMTRVGHGVGFWETEWTGLEGNPGSRLDKSAKQFGEVWAYVGDDGLIYLTK